jgi:hypothetical protein
VKGETYDPETGALHLAHALWNLAALIELNHEGPLFDPDFDQAAFVAKWKPERLPVPTLDGDKLAHLIKYGDAG